MEKAIAVAHLVPVFKTRSLAVVKQWSSTVDIAAFSSLWLENIRCVLFLVTMESMCLCTIGSLVLYTVPL